MSCEPRSPANWQRSCRYVRPVGLSKLEGWAPRGVIERRTGPMTSSDSLTFLLPFFDPRGDSLPEDVFSVLATRARALLAERSPREAEFAIHAVDYMLDNLDDEHRGVLESGPEAASPAVSPAQALKRCIGKYDIDGLDDFPDAAWPEFFAALACRYLNAAFFELQRGRRSALRSLESAAHGEPAYDGGSGPRILVAGYAVKAMEAICCGEFIKNGEAEMELIATEKAEEKIRLGSRKAAIARHAQEKIVEEDFVAYLREEDGRLDNIAKAAESYCETTRFEEINVNKKTGESILRGENPAVTLQNYAYRRGLSRKPRKRRKTGGPNSC